MKLRDASNVSRTIAAVHIRLADNSSRLWKTMHVRDAGNVSRVGYSSASDMVATASPATVFGASSSHISARVYTNASTASATGGTPPYTYAWSAPGGGWDVGTPTLASTNFRSPPLAPGNSAEVTATCTVTDAHGNPATTNEVTISAYNDEIYI